MKLRHVFFLRVRVRFSLLRIGRVSVAACRLLQPQLYGGSGWFSWAGSRWQGGEVASKSISYHPCPLAVSRRATHTGHSAHAKDEDCTACRSSARTNLGTTGAPDFSCSSSLPSWAVVTPRKHSIKTSIPNFDSRISSIE
jgi:hypothetical protein